MISRKQCTCINRLGSSTNHIRTTCMEIPIWSKTSPASLVSTVCQLSFTPLFHLKQMRNSLFNFCPQQEYTYILLYVDVIVLTTFSVALKDKIIIALKTEFEMSDLGPFSYFFGHLY